MNSPKSPPTMPSRPSSAPEQQRNGFVYASEIAVFATVFALTIAASLRPPPFPPATPGSGSMLIAFFTSFVGATLIVLYLIRRKRGTRFFSVLLALAVFSGIVSLIETFFGLSAAILTLSVSVLLWYCVKRVWLFDLLLLLGIAGLSANMGGSLVPVAAAAILAILSVYDIVAVYLTKHMVEMGESLLRQRVFFAIIVPRGLRGFQTRLQEVAPGSGHYFIGTGDLVLPALLISSATYVRLEAGVAAAIGALLGLLATTALFLSQKSRRAMPALPPIALGAIIGYLVGTAIFP